jgi:hypothetical protein
MINRSEIPPIQFGINLGPCSILVSQFFGFHNVYTGPSNTDKILGFLYVASNGLLSKIGRNNRREFIHSNATHEFVLIVS